MVQQIFLPSAATGGLRVRVCQPSSTRMHPKRRAIRSPHRLATHAPRRRRDVRRRARGTRAAVVGAGQEGHRPGDRRVRQSLGRRCTAPRPLRPRKTASPASAPRGRAAVLVALDVAAGADDDAGAYRDRRASPQRVTAPIDGVIKEILVDPNRPVTPGQPMLRFDETTLRNRSACRAGNGCWPRPASTVRPRRAFIDEKARHELAQARAELDLKKAERDYAADLLKRDRDQCRARRHPDLLQTRTAGSADPVKTGERIMQIADPTRSRPGSSFRWPMQSCSVTARGCACSSMPTR